MRHNGLPGNDFVAVADVEPQVADALLELLRDADVPAYADAATPHRGVYNEVRLPDRPTDRLFVQRDRRDVAQALLRDRLPELRADYEASGDEALVDLVDMGDRPGDSGRPAQSTDVAQRSGTEITDDIWAGIVASFGEPAFEGRPGLGDLETSPVPSPPEPRGMRPGWSLVSGPRDYIAVDTDDHFEPPPPPPIGRLEPIGTLAWIGVLGAPIFFALALWAGLDVEGWLGLAGVAAFVGGFGVLFTRMAPEHDPDGDDGAEI